MRASRLQHRLDRATLRHRYIAFVHTLEGQRQVEDPTRVVSTGEHATQEIGQVVADRRDPETQGQVLAERGEDAQLWSRVRHPHRTDPPASAGHSDGHVPGLGSPDRLDNVTDAEPAGQFPHTLNAFLAAFGHYVGRAELL